MLAQDGLAIGFDFAEGDGFEAACALKSEGEPPNSAEEIENLECHHRPPSARARTPAE